MNSYPQPYSGAPPIPQGYNINPSHWNTGVWQRNPSFNWNQNAAPPIPQAAWVPGAAWNQSHPQQPQPQQQQQNFNPYKKPINPPSAEYLAQKLVDNPLGLTNMIPREQLYGPGVDGAPPETPWIWNPRTLDDAEPSNRPTRHASEPPTAVSSTQPPFRHASEPPPNNAPAPLARPKKYAVSAAAQAASRTPQPSPSHPPTSSASAYASSRAAAANTAVTNSSAPPPTSADTPSRALRTTFSTRIVRTPDHYRESTSPTRDIDNPALTRSATMPSITSGVNQMSMSSSSASQSHTTPSRSQSTSRAATISRHQSVSNAEPEPITDAGVFVDEPGTLLSPLVMNTPMPKSTKPLGRHHTEPSLSSIPEGRHRSNHHHRRSSSRHESSRRDTPSKSSSKTPTPRTPAESSTGYSGSRTTGTSSASAAAVAAQSRTTPPSATTDVFGNLPNPLPTPPRIFEVPASSRSYIYSPPNSAGTSANTTPSRGTGLGSSSTVTYTARSTAMGSSSTPGYPAGVGTQHGSSTTSFGVIPTSAGISSASASASATRSSRSQTRDVQDHVRESSQARSGRQIERAYSQSREPSRAREPSRSREPPRFPGIAPDGTPAAPVTPEEEAGILAELSKKYTIHGEPPRRQSMRAYGKAETASNGNRSGNTSAPVTNTTFEHFPLPTPPESLLEQRRQDAAAAVAGKEAMRFLIESRTKYLQQTAPLPPPQQQQQQQQQQSSHRQSSLSYQTPRTSPYANNVSPQRSPYSNDPSPQSHSRSASASQHTSPYPSPSPNNTAPQRPPYPSPHSTASSSQPSPQSSPPKVSHSSHPSYPYGNANVNTTATTTTVNGAHHSVRLGFWNSRGDHLTPAGYIVYAPPHEANPPELADYPGQWTGFRDEQGRFMKFEVGRKELPESLPRNGMPPERPYESFIRYR